MADDYKISFQ